MSLIPVREYASAEEMMAAYRARLRPKQPVVPVALVSPPEPATEREPEPPVEAPVLDQAISRYRLAYDSGLVTNSKRIILEVAQESGLTVNDLKSAGRQRPLARARQRAMWLIAKQTELSLPQIGKLFNRDHTTVLHAIRYMNRTLGANVRGCGTDAGKIASRKRWEERQ